MLKKENNTLWAEIDVIAHFRTHKVKQSYLF